MTETTQQIAAWLERCASTPYGYLTTIGRKTGMPHRIEIWFAAEGQRVYLMSGGRDRSDWVRNLMVNPRVTIELEADSCPGIARIIPPDSADDQRARDLLTAKYASPGNPLDDWKRRSLPVVIEFASDAVPTRGAGARARNGAPPTRAAE